MYEDAAFDARGFAELIVAEATPGSGHPKPKIETAPGSWCCLHAPTPTAVLEEDILHQWSSVSLLFFLQVEEVILPRAVARQQHDFPRLVHFAAVGQCLIHQRPRRKPVGSIATDDVTKLLGSHQESLLEPGIFRCGGALLLPARIQPTDPSPEVRDEAVAWLVSHLDAIVQGIKLTDQRVVGLGDDRSLGFRLKLAAQSFHHFTSEVLEH
mmetsp:Transcript_18501/g.43455  ORF Transcript_18501/g.43455 Transcript_18501/m.43455 type:complete len:211 (+) Transcript_18501:141-773(+)